MGRVPVEESLKVARFAAEKGCSVQWARAHKRRNSQEWQDFVGGRVEVRSDAVSDYDKALEAERRCWAAYLRADALAEGESEPSALAALNRAAAQARAAYQAAHKHTVAAALEARQLVPRAKVEQLRRVLARIGELVQSQRTTLAGRMPQEMRAAFFAAFDESRGAWNAGVQELDAEVEALLC